MHAEMQAHARMSALISRRTAFTGLKWNFPFPNSFHGRSSTRPRVKRKVRGGFSAQRASPHCRNEPVLPGAVIKHLKPAFFRSSYQTLIPLPPYLAHLLTEISCAL